MRQLSLLRLRHPWFSLLLQTRLKLSDSTTAAIIFCGICATSMTLIPLPVLAFHFSFPDYCYDKDVRKAVERISKNSELSLFMEEKSASEMEEVINMQTLDGQQGLEFFPKKKSQSRQILHKRSRFVPLQKYTLHKLQVICEKNRETLCSDYKIKSLPTMKKQLKNPPQLSMGNYFYPLSTSLSASNHHHIL